MVVGQILKTTWRLAWREALTWIELAMLAILTLLAAIAAIGSPNAGDGAIQMYAVAYAVAPFALVLIVGQMGGNALEEAQWWSRPLSRGTVMMGRFCGYVAVGAAMVGAVAAWGWITMTIMARLSPAAGAWWTLQWALFTLPSLLVVVGAAMWLQSRVTGRTAYFAPAILGSLVIAFVEYKLPLFTGVLPHLTFFNPFPGFLELGLALPPRLLSPSVISGWLWLNRVVWSMVGLALLVLAIRKKTRLYPLRRPRLARRLSYFLGIVALLGAVRLYGISRAQSPPVEPNLALTTNFTCTRARSDLAVNAGTGELAGRIACHVPRGGRLTFAMNAGLQARVMTPGNAITHVSMGVAPASALRQWTVDIPISSKILTLSIQGRLVPEPSTLPYPPFKVGVVYSGLAAGFGRLYVADAAQGLPSFLPPSSPVTLRVRGLAHGAIITNAARPRPDVFVGSIGGLVLSDGPLTPSRRGPTTVWLARGSRLALVAYLPYVGALRNLKHWLALPPQIALVPSPVTTAALWKSPIVVYSTDHPYIAPLDPINGSAVSPTSYTATLTLAHLFFGGSSSFRSQFGALLTSLVLFHHSNAANLQLLLGQIRRGQVVEVGILSRLQRQEVLETWARVSRWTPRRQHRWLVVLQRRVHKGGGS